MTNEIQLSEGCLSGGPADLSWTRPDLATLDTQGRKTNGEEDKRVKKGEQRDISNAWFNLKFPW